MAFFMLTLIYESRLKGGYMSNLEFWRKSYDPFRESNFFGRNLDRVFDDWLVPVAPKYRANMEKMVMSPSCDVTESKTAYSMKFDLPGLTKDQIKIDLHENTLSVSGERREEKKEEDKERKQHISELYYGSFSRSFTFPESIDAERSDAKFENGVLTITIPKKEGSLRRQISVK